MSTPDQILRIRHGQGISMVELIMFIVIVSVGIAGILYVLNITTKHSADPQRRKQALAIAEALMEEIQGSRFTFCDPTDARAEMATNPVVGINNGPDNFDCATAVEDVGPEIASGDTRPYDNVNDYVSAFNTPTTINTDLQNQPLPAGYSATVTIIPEALNGIASGSLPTAMEVLRIRVTVSDGRDDITLDGYRARYAPRWIP